MSWPEAWRARKLKWDGKMTGCYETRASLARRRRREPSPRRRLLAVAGCVVLLHLLAPPAEVDAQDKLKVVTTLPTYAAIAREITGDLADVEAIARGDEDPHFVTPRPSYAALIKKADLFVATGLDLELWAPMLLDRAANSKVMDGAPGFVAAYAGIELLDIPTDVSRAAGDVHVFGNPHIHTDPVNAVIISKNILAGLRRIDEERSEIYEANYRGFAERLLRRLYGDQLVEIFGIETLFELARTYRLWGFLSEKSFQDRPLIDYMGGWLAEGAASGTATSRATTRTGCTSAPASTSRAPCTWSRKSAFRHRRATCASSWIGWSRTESPPCWPPTTSAEAKSRTSHRVPARRR